MAADLVIWHGDAAEVLELMAAIERHCECRASNGSCAAHQALLNQRFIDGLVFVRWMRERLLREEQAG